MYACSWPREECFGGDVVRAHSDGPRRHRQDAGSCAAAGGAVILARSIGHTGKDGFEVEPLTRQVGQAAARIETTEYHSQARWSQLYSGPLVDRSLYT